MTLYIGSVAEVQIQDFLRGWREGEYTVSTRMEAIVMSDDPNDTTVGIQLYAEPDKHRVLVQWRRLNSPRSRYDHIDSGGALKDYNFNSKRIQLRIDESTPIEEVTAVISLVKGGLP